MNWAPRTRDTESNPVDSYPSRVGAEARRCRCFVGQTLVAYRPEGDICEVFNRISYATTFR